MRTWLLGLAAALSLSGQGVEFIKANYTKYEYRVPMRDGKRLFTSVYVPKDDTQTYGILLSRTPYSVAPYGADQYRDTNGYNAIIGREKFIFAYQDVRGRYMSEGEFINMTPHKAVKSGPQDVDESTDTYDTIEWLTKNLPRNNGRVCTYGSSYPGFYTAAGMIDAHPAHVCAHPQAPIVDWFTGDDFHHHGAFWLPHAFRFFASFGKARPELTTKNNPPFDFGTPDGYDFYLKTGPLYNFNERYFKNTVAFWNEMMKNDTYTEFWKTRNLRPHVKAIKPAVLITGGWLDAENLYGALQLFGSLEKQSPGGQHMLTMGPWCHGCWYRSGDGDQLGDIKFNQKTGPWYQENVVKPFFTHHLYGKGDWKPSKVLMFELGTNQWRRFDSWPPKNTQAKSLYFHANGKLSFEAPADPNGFDEYVSDPARPVPLINAIAQGMAATYMTSDQRFASRRPDVLVYETEPLEEDITIAGPLRPALTVSTTGTDSDWIVKLIDVYPGDYPNPAPNPTGVEMGGYQQLVRGDVMRGKFRNSYERPEAFRPGEPTAVNFEINDVFHTFRRGHRIMIQIQSTWFPLIDRNPQKFLNINEAREADFTKATQRVYRRSSVEVRILPAK